MDQRDPLGGLSKHAAGSQVDVKTILEYNDVDISALDTT